MRDLDWFCAAILAGISAIGCSRSASDPSPAPAEHVEVREFLGVAENDVGKIDDPDSALFGVTTMTKVETVDFERYQRSKAAGKLKAEEFHGDYVYFAIETGRDVPLGYASAWITVTERYRAFVPQNNASSEEPEPTRSTDR